MAEPEQEPQDAEQGERKLLLGRGSSCSSVDEPSSVEVAHASKSGPFDVSPYQRFSYVAIAFAASIVMVVLQKGVFETRTSHGLFRRFVFMALMTGLAKALIFFIAAIQEMSTVGSLKQLAVQTYQYAMSVKVGVAIWVPSLVFESLGLMLIPASLMIMLRCLNIPCTAGMRCVAFGNVPSVTQWLSVVMLTIGVICGAVLQSSSRDNFATGADVHWPSFYLGILAGLSTCMLTAFRFVLEETYVRHDSVPPLMVVGVEGLLMLSGCFVVFVACHCIGLEDWWTTLAMLKDSNMLLYLISAYLITNMAYSWACIMITATIDSTTRVVVRGVSIYGVWVLQLGVFVYTAGLHGERWITPDSVFYMIAMGVTIGASVFYASFK